MAPVVASRPLRAKTKGKNMGKNETASCIGATESLCFAFQPIAFYLMYSVAQDSSNSSPSDDQASGSCDLAVVLSRLSVYRREAKSSYENVENWLTKNRKAQQELDHERAEINLLFEEFAGLQQEREQAIFEHHQGVDFSESMMIDRSFGSCELFFN